VAVDDAGQDVLAGTIDYARICRGVEILADGRDLAIAHEHVGVLQRAVRDGDHGRVANERFRRRRLLRPCDLERKSADDGNQQESGDELFHVAPPWSAPPWWRFGKTY